MRRRSSNVQVLFVLLGGKLMPELRRMQLDQC